MSTNNDTPQLMTGMTSDQNAALQDQAAQKQAQAQWASKPIWTRLSDGLKAAGEGNFIGGMIRDAVQQHFAGPADPNFKADDDTIDAVQNKLGIFAPQDFKDKYLRDSISESDLVGKLFMYKDMQHMQDIRDNTTEGKTFSTMANFGEWSALGILTGGIGDLEGAVSKGLIDASTVAKIPGVVRAGLLASATDAAGIGRIPGLLAGNVGGGLAMQTADDAYQGRNPSKTELIGTAGQGLFFSALEGFMGGGRGSVETPREPGATPLEEAHGYDPTVSLADQPQHVEALETAPQVASQAAPEGAVEAPQATSATPEQAAADPEGTFKEATQSTREFRDWVRSLPKESGQFLPYLRNEARFLQEQGVNGPIGVAMNSTPEQLGAEITRAKIQMGIQRLEAAVAADPENKGLTNTLAEAHNKMDAFQQRLAALGVTPRKVQTAAQLPGVRAGEGMPKELQHELTPENAEGVPNQLKNAVPAYELDGKRYQLNFKSPTDKALYIVGLGKSRIDEKVIGFLKKQFPNLGEAELRDYGSRMRTEYIDDLARSVPEKDRPLMNEAVSFDVDTWHKRAVDTEGTKAAALEKSGEQHASAIAAHAVHGEGVQHLEIVPADGVPKDPFKMPNGFKRSHWNAAVDQAKDMASDEKIAKGLDTDDPVVKAAHAVLTEGGIDPTGAHPDTVRQAIAHELYGRRLADEKLSAQEGPKGKRVAALKEKLTGAQKAASEVDPKDTDAVARSNADIAATREELGDAKDEMDKAGISGIEAPRMILTMPDKAPVDAEAEPAAEGTAQEGATSKALKVGAIAVPALALSMGLANNADAATGNRDNTQNVITRILGAVGIVAFALLAKRMAFGAAKVAAAEGEAEARTLINQTKVEASDALKATGVKAQVVDSYSKAGFAKEVVPEKPAPDAKEQPSKEFFKTYGAVRQGVIDGKGTIRLPFSSKSWAIPDSYTLPWVGKIPLRWLQQIQDIFGCDEHNGVRLGGDAIFGGYTTGRQGGRAAGGEGYNPSGASITHERLFHEMTAQIMEEDERNYADWAKSQGSKSKTLSFASATLQERYYKMVRDELAVKGSSGNKYAEASANAFRKGWAAVPDRAKAIQEASNTTGIQGSRLNDLAALNKNENYFHLQTDHDALQAARIKYGDAEVVRGFKEAIQKAQPELGEGQAQELATKFLQNKIFERYQTGGTKMQQLAATEIRSLLKRTTDMSDEQIEQQLALMDIPNSGPVPGFFKERVTMDRNHVAQLKDAEGNVSPFAIKDSYQSNMRQVYGEYMRKASGIMAVGQDGVRTGFDLTSDQGRASFFNYLKMTGADPYKVALQEQGLDRIQGLPESSDILGRRSPLTNALMQALNIRYGQGFFFAHIAELGNLIGPKSLGNLAAQMPTLISSMRKMRDGSLPEGMARTLQEMGMTGLDSAYARVHLSMDDNKALDGLMRTVQVGTDTVMKLNLFKHLLYVTKALKGAAELRGLADHVTGGNPIDADMWKHMEPMGMTKDMLDEMAPALRKVMKFDDDSGALQYVDMKRMQELDYTGSQRLSDYIFRATAEAAKERVGMATKLPYLTGNAGSLVSQFQGVMISAFNRLRRDVQFFDPEVATRWAMSSIMAAASWQGKTYLQYMGDPSERKKIMTWDNTFKAAFRNNSVGAPMALLGDLGATLTGNPAPFSEVTNSGRASGVSIPALDAVNTGTKTLGDTLRDTFSSNYHWTEPNARELTKWLNPFWMVQPGVSMAIQGLPAQQPKLTDDQ